MYHQEPKATEFIQFHKNLKGLPQNIPKRRPWIDFIFIALFSMLYNQMWDWNTKDLAVL